MRTDEIGDRIADGRSHAASGMWSRFNLAMGWDKIMPIHRAMVTGMVPSSEATQIARYAIVLAEGTIRQHMQTGGDRLRDRLEMAAHCLEEMLEASEHTRRTAARLALVAALTYRALGRPRQGIALCLIADRRSDTNSFEGGMAHLLLGDLLPRSSGGNLADHYQKARAELAMALSILRFSSEHGSHRARMLCRARLCHVHQALGNKWRWRWHSLLMWRSIYDAHTEQGTHHLARWPVDAERMELRSLDPKATY